MRAQLRPFPGRRRRRRHRRSRTRAGSGGAHPTDDAVIASQLDRFEPEPTTSELWWRAAKLPMYSVALAPLAAAAAMCHHWYGCVNAPQLGCLAAGACLVIDGST